jgi:hypothetical protein
MHRRFFDDELDVDRDEEQERRRDPLRMPDLRTEEEKQEEEEPSERKVRSTLPSKLDVRHGAERRVDREEHDRYREFVERRREPRD